MYKIATVGGCVKIKVLVIAPYKGLIELIKNLEPELVEFDIILHQADLIESLELVEAYEEENIDFIISRGGTADLLKKSTSIPVIEINVSGYDILRILTLLKGYQGKIEMIGFNSIIQGFESVSNLINMDLSYTVINHKDEVSVALKKAKKTGVRIIVGDTVTVTLANEIGLQGVLITSGRESVLEAFYKAHQMNVALEELRTQSIIYQNLLTQIDSAVLMITENGEIQFANEKFYRMLNIKKDYNQKNSLFESLPYFEKMIHNSRNHEFQPNYQISLEDMDRLFDIKLGYLGEKNDQGLYFFEIKEATGASQDVEMTVIYPQQTNSFPQIVMGSKLYQKAIQIAVEQIKSHQPITVYGEVGTGKRIFISSLFSSSFSKGSTLMEIEINRMSTKVFNKFIKMIEEESEQTLIHIRGLENITNSQQQRLFGNPIKAQLVFSFVGEEGILDKNSLKLDTEIVKIFREKSIYFPPLRERLDELMELIQTFIIQFNEIYGKQVVGVRPNVLHALHSLAWKENLIELKQVIKEFVKQSEGEYLSEDLLHLLPNPSQYTVAGNHSQGTFVDLNQPLDAIEAQIINTIMEQENMNQSRVAKRLGINRSTLWRKLKKDES